MNESNYAYKIGFEEGWESHKLKVEASHPAESLEDKEKRLKKELEEVQLELIKCK